MRSPTILKAIARICHLGERRRHRSPTSRRHVPQGIPVSRNLEFDGHTHHTSSPVTLLVSYRQVRGRSLAVQHGREVGFATWELQRRAPDSEPPSRSPGTPSQHNPVVDGRTFRPSRPVTCRIPYRGTGIPRSTTRAGTRSSSRRAVSPTRSGQDEKRATERSHRRPETRGPRNRSTRQSAAPPNGASTASNGHHVRLLVVNGRPSAAFAHAASRALRVASRKRCQEPQLPQAAASALDGAVRRSIVATKRRMGRRTKL